MTRSAQFWVFLGLGGVGAVALALLGYAIFTAPVNAKLKIAADAANTESYELASSIADVVERVHPHLRIEVVPTSGAVENMRLLVDRKVDLALLEADAIIRRNVSLVAILYPDLFQLLVRKDSGIESMAGLERHRIALPPTSSGQFGAFWFLANHYGVAPERLDAVPMSEEEANKAILDGSVDALFRVAGARNKQISMLVSRADLRLIPIDQGEAMHLRQPAYRATTLPKGAYRGDLPLPANDLPTLAVDRLLVASDAVDPSIIRTITSVLFENRRELAMRMPLAAFISQPAFDKGTPMPVHPGAMEYYNREQPSFLEAKAEFLALLLSLAVVLATISIAVKRHLDERMKARIEDYAAELLELEKEAKMAKSIPELNTQKDRLTELLARVVEDSRRRRVRPDGLHLFAFVWESVNYTVNDHEEQLRLGPGPMRSGRARIGSAAPEPEPAPSS